MLTYAEACQLLKHKHNLWYHLSLISVTDVDQLYFIEEM